MWDQHREKMFWTNNSELVTQHMTAFLSVRLLSEYTSSELFTDTFWDIDRFCMCLCFQHISYTLVMFCNSEFTDRQCHVIELSVSEQFQQFGVNDRECFFLFPWQCTVNMIRSLS